MNMGAKFAHYNFNVFDLKKSLEFYKKALGLTEKRRKESEDGSFILVYLTDNKTDFTLELTWLRDRTEPYSMGDNEVHLCLTVSEDYDKVFEFHKENGWVCYENKDMGLYFIKDLDEHWIEILPQED